MEDSSNILAELSSLVGIFFDDVQRLGLIEEVAFANVPEPQRSLLNHEHHMTVTVEKFHSSPVDVKVLNLKSSDNTYSREILLNKKDSGSVVQYGIVRLNFEYLSDEVRSEIEGQQTPLGRILISHNVLRKVKLLGLYRIEPGERLQEVCNVGSDQLLFGRTALIYCDDQPAVELLEVVVV